MVLPRLADAVDDSIAVQKQAPPGSDVEYLAIDIADAFHNIPLHSSEQPFATALVGGTFVVFTALAMGSRSAPGVWGRFAAFLGRFVAAVCQEFNVRTEIYVDDPHVGHGGSPREPHVIPRCGVARSLWVWVSVGLAQGGGGI